MKSLDKVLERIYNTLGNFYLTDNFDTDTFEFKVNIRKGDRDDDLQDYIVEVYSVPDLPESFMYKDSNNSGIHISRLGHEFKELIKYVDSSFGEFRKTIGIKFMNVK